MQVPGGTTGSAGAWGVLETPLENAAPLQSQVPLSHSPPSGGWAQIWKLAVTVTVMVPRRELLPGQRLCPRVTPGSAECVLILQMGRGSLEAVDKYSSEVTQWHHWEPQLRQLHPTLGGL